MFTVGSHLSSPWQPFSLLPTTVGRNWEILSFTLPQSELSILRGGHPVSDPRPLHRPLNLSRRYSQTWDSIMSCCTTLLLDTCCLATWHKLLWNNPRWSTCYWHSERRNKTYNSQRTQSHCIGTSWLLCIYQHTRWQILQGSLAVIINRRKNLKFCST
jgi:hypothetical protein